MSLGKIAGISGIAWNGKQNPETEASDGHLLLTLLLGHLSLVRYRTNPYAG